jgi:hypothetical protein
VTVLLALLAVGASPLVAMQAAGADEPSGAQFTAAVPITPDPTSGQGVTPGTPFSSGQTISVQVPANTALNANAGVVIVECSAPGGVPPTQTNACDTLTVQGDTIIPAADGSFTYNNYQLFALPDAISLGENASHLPICDLTHECVLYIGNNFNDFNQPHFWSQGYFVTPNGNDGGGHPGDGSAQSVSASQSTVVANPSAAPADGLATSTVTVTLKGSNTAPVSGAPVSLGQGSGHSTITPSSSTTNASGQAAFTVKDSTAEPVTYTATSGSVTVTQTGSVTFQALAQSISFTSTAPSQAVVGGPTYTVSATGGASGNPVTFSIDPSSTSGCHVSGSTVSFAAPSGTCVINANQAGNAQYAAAPQLQQSFAVRVLVITTTALPGGTVAQPYSATLSAVGGNLPYTWKKIGSLPKGLKLNKSSGVISGTPKKAGTSTFTIEVLDHKVGKPKTQNTATTVLSITIS